MARTTPSSNHGFPDLGARFRAYPDHVASWHPGPRARAPPETASGSAGGSSPGPAHVDLGLLSPRPSTSGETGRPRPPAAARQPAGAVAGRRLRLLARASARPLSPAAVPAAAPGRRRRSLLFGLGRGRLLDELLLDRPWASASASWAVAGRTTFFATGAGGTTDRVPAPVPAPELLPAPRKRHPAGTPPEGVGLNEQHGRADRGERRSRSHEHASRNSR